MTKENLDEKLINFLRSHKPDVPNEAQDFEQRLLKATARASLGTIFSGLFRNRWVYIVSSCAAACAIALTFVPRPNSTPQTRVSVSHGTQTPLPELTDEEAYLFMTESFESFGTTFSSSFDSEFERI
ncbi:hypothetical protein EBR21_05410 [bacterium]|nr:hypothetical protein [bacterium]